MALSDQEKKEYQPRKGLSWALTLGPNPPIRNFAWTDIKQALEDIYPDGDSFVILEQTDADGWYWFLQSAIALAGPYAGEYVVGCGCPRGEGGVLLERVVHQLNQVIPYFEGVFQGQPLDLSGFEDRSDWLPVNQKK